MKIDHDAAPGPLTRCQISGSTNLFEIIDLGHQPPCDALVSAEGLRRPETTYPLRLMHCPDSGLAQLDYVVAGEIIYPPEYPYRSGISRPLEEYQRAFAHSVMERFARSSAKSDLWVDIGSNDGTLLTGVRSYGMRTQGVEPTNIARIAQKENGIDTLQAFFTEQLAREISGQLGQAQFITMTNVFAHMADLGEVMRGICALLHPQGVFITESHYLLDVLDRNQFDTIYHEHIRTYSVKALCALMPQYGLEVFDVERASRYGGNLRAYVARKGVHPVSPAVGELLALEETAGLHTPLAWNRWRERVYRNRSYFMECLHRAQRLGLRTAGCSAPGRASTLLNFYGVTPDLMAYTGELSTSLKLGKHVPGCHIPIVDNRRLAEDQPDYVVLLAWHYAEVIVERLRREGVKSGLIQPLPEYTLTLLPERDRVAA